MEELRWSLRCKASVRDSYSSNPKQVIYTEDLERAITCHGTRARLSSSIEPNSLKDNKAEKYCDIDD